MYGTQGFDIKQWSDSKLEVELRRAREDVLRYEREQARRVQEQRNSLRVERRRWRR